MKKVILAFASSMALAVALVACGNSGGGSGSSTTTTSTSCGTAGYVTTAQGCLPEWSSNGIPNPNYGNFNGTPIPVTSTYTYGTGSGYYYGNTYGNYYTGATYPQTPYPYYNLNYNYQSGIYNNTVYPAYSGSPWRVSVWW